MQVTNLLLYSTAISGFNELYTCLCIASPLSNNVRRVKNCNYNALNIIFLPLYNLSYLCICICLHVVGQDWLVCMSSNNFSLWILFIIRLCFRIIFYVCCSQCSLFIHCSLIQRLKPSDTVLSFRHCERQTFSMRPDRDVVYSISVQTYSDGVQQFDTTDVQTQRFTLNGKHTRSKVSYISLCDIEKLNETLINIYLVEKFTAYGTLL